MWNHIKLIKLLKKSIPFCIKIILIRILVSIQTCYYYFFPKDVKLENGKKIFVLLSTDYSNLGDHAMTYAQMKLLYDNFPDYHIYEVLVGDTLKCLKNIKNDINPDDIITLKGGGNIGMEYFREELIRRKIIKTFTDNRIVMFPQTVYFPKTQQGNKEFNETVRIFNKHNDFHAFFRDETSYEMMRPYINKNLYLTPDIVFYLKNMIRYKKESKGVVFCMRDDVEGIFSRKEKESIYEVLNRKFKGNVCVIDTITDYKIDSSDRLKELEKIWKIMANSELVITDRLHGMIFSVLLGTPCIIFNTYNHKLRGQYKWIEDLNYVYCIDFNEQALEKTIDIAMEIKPEALDPDVFDVFFNKIIECINREKIQRRSIK